MSSPIVLSVGVVGRGLIGGTLLDQVTSEKARLLKERNIDVRIVAICDVAKQLSCPEGLAVGADWKAAYEASTAPGGWEVFDKTMTESTNGVVVDCTASAHPAGKYEEWLKKGLCVVTPNKKAGSGDYEYYKKVRAAGPGHFLYETTVGAGLPIIDTIKGLMDTGDKVLKVEGIFSGTLSYIFNTFGTNSDTFSEVVAKAKAQGFTEPDPRDDLNGLDVARKVVILARECGMKKELSEIPIQSLVDESLTKLDVATYMEEMKKFDEAKSAEFKAANDAGEVLRYVGTVDIANQCVSVKLGRYPKTDAFAGLQGADNIVKITTERYSPPTGQPLVVRGPGAGAAVTAGGVFYDVLRIAHRLGAPTCTSSL